MFSLTNALVPLPGAGQGRGVGDTGRQLRVAILGAAGYEHESDAAKVECFAWDRLRKVKNLADYDVLIVDLLSLDGPDGIDARQFKRLFDAKTASQILGEGEGAIYVLGDPRFELSHETPEARVTEPFLLWTGMEFRWDGRGGEVLEAGPVGRFGPFASLATGVDRYEYGMSDCEPVRDDEAWLWGVWNLSTFNGAGLRADCVVSDILTTRYGPSVAFVARHTMVLAQDVVQRYRGGKGLAGSRAPEVVSGPMVFLPGGRLSEGETIELILRDVHGVETSAPEPEWIEDFVAPGQREIDGAIAETDAEVEALLQRREELLREREEARRPLELLYQTGDALEEAVWSVLEALGAAVKRSEKGLNASDGWASVRLGGDVLEFVLEIKGEEKEHFGFKSLRQLTDWISEGIDSEGKEYKGLMVGNGSRTRPPRWRVWPFNSNFVGNAEKRRHAAIRSEDLYVLYLLDRRGELDREGFWRALHETRGPFDARPYREKLTAAEAERLASVT